VNTKLCYYLAAALFLVSALLSAFGKSQDYGMGACWLAIAVLFFVIGTSSGKTKE
jgi:hypothetical protein